MCVYFVRQSCQDILKVKKLLAISSLPQQWKTRSLEQDSNLVQLDELGEKHARVMPSDQLLARIYTPRKVAT